MSELTEFLLARVAEDEWDARRALGLDMGARLKDQAERVAHQHGSATPPDEPNAADRLWWTTQDVVQWLAPYGPARVLAECAAKRAIVEAAAEATGLDMQVDGEFAVGPRNMVLYPYCGDVILRALALPYAGHPDFREEWRA